jgi:hypothetical protein
MLINREQIMLFIERYAEEYGITLSLEKAFEEASKLFQLYKLIYVPQ